MHIFTNQRAIFVRAHGWDFFSKLVDPDVLPSNQQFAIEAMYGQWPFQEPIDWRYLPYVRPMFQAYVRGYTPKIWPYVVQYLHFRILEFPLIWLTDLNVYIYGCV